MTTPKTPARLDADRTAVPLTRIEHHPPHGGCISPYMPLVNQEYVDADGKRPPLSAPEPSSPVLLPIGAKYGVERCVAWLKARAVEIESEIDDNNAGSAKWDRSHAANLRTAARDGRNLRRGVEAMSAHTVHQLPMHEAATLDIGEKKALARRMREPAEKRRAASALFALAAAAGFGIKT